MRSAFLQRRNLSGSSLLDPILSFAKPLSNFGGGVFTRPTNPGLMVKSPAAVPVKSASVEADGKDTRKDASEITKYLDQNKQEQGI